MNYIVYGHTDYLDILEIQSDYITERGHITLFLNTPPISMSGSSQNKLDRVLTKFDKVVYYDDSKPYASRLLDCLKSVEDYFIFLHDIDILLSVNNSMMNEFVEFLKGNNFDRVCLQHTYNLNSSLVVHYSHDLSLVKSCSVKDYIYNVNPSIWKRDTLVEIMSNFPNETYRSIEFNVQEFCAKYNIFKLHSVKPLSCGWFLCDKSFKFLHVTHLGKILPLNSECMTPSRQSYIDAKDEYTEMYNRYNMQNANIKYFGDGN